MCSKSGWGYYRIQLIALDFHVRLIASRVKNDGRNKSRYQFCPGSYKSVARDVSVSFFIAFWRLNILISRAIELLVCTFCTITTSMSSFFLLNWWKCRDTLTFGKIAVGVSFFYDSAVLRTVTFRIQWTLGWRTIICMGDTVSVNGCQLCLYQDFWGLGAYLVRPVKRIPLK